MKVTVKVSAGLHDLFTTFRTVTQVRASLGLVRTKKLSYKTKLTRENAELVHWLDLRANRAHFRPISS